MYIKQTKADEPYNIIITKEEMKEAFRNPVSYEMFKQALITHILLAYKKEKESVNEA